MSEDGYEEQIVFPKEKKALVAQEEINTDNRQKVTVKTVNLKTGETYTGRLAITENRQIYLPTEIQQMLKSAGDIRIL